jgi:hypothetical protein
MKNEITKVYIDGREIINTEVASCACLMDGDIDFVEWLITSIKYLDDYKNLKDFKRFLKPAINLGELCFFYGNNNCHFRLSFNLSVTDKYPTAVLSAVYEKVE